LSIKRWAAKRDTSEKEIVAAMRQFGASVEHLDQPLDLLVGFHRHSYLVEVKTGKKKLEPTQQDFIDAWRGNPVPVLRTPADAIEWLSTLPKES